MQRPISSGRPTTRRQNNGRTIKSQKNRGQRINFHNRQLARTVVQYDPFLFSLPTVRFGRGGTEADQATATVVYYAAIASALLFHQRRITEHTYDKLEKAYGDLEQKDWIPSELKELFRKAKAACQER